MNLFICEVEIVRRFVGLEPIYAPNAKVARDKTWIEFHSMDMDGPEEVDVTNRVVSATRVEHLGEVPEELRGSGVWHHPKHVPKYASGEDWARVKDLVAPARTGFVSPAKFASRELALLKKRKADIEEQISKWEKIKSA